MTAQNTSEPRRILVVDDNVDAAESIALALQIIGHTTEVAFNGPAALALASTFRPELALLDIGLPVMDGYELARRLRQMEATATTRLVALSGHGQATDREKSAEAGFDEHHVKPLDLESIWGIAGRLAQP